MICKLMFAVFLSVTAILFSGCSSRNAPVSQTKNEASEPKSETPETKTLAVPPQVKFVETPRFKELQNQFEAAEKEVNRLDEERKRLLVVYTEEYPKVKKISRELAKAEEKLKVVQNLLNAEREKFDIQVKTPPV